MFLLNIFLNEVKGFCYHILSGHLFCILHADGKEMKLLPYSVHRYLLLTVPFLEPFTIIPNMQFLFQVALYLP